MTDGDWGQGFAKSLGVFLNGQAIAHPDARGERVVDTSFYVLFNAHHEPLVFTLPTRDWGAHWITVLDTSAPLPEESDRIVTALRITELDESGVTLASYVEPMLETVPALGRAYFAVQVPDEGLSYRVAVDSWNTVEEGSK